MVKKIFNKNIIFLIGSLILIGHSKISSSAEPWINIKAKPSNSQGSNYDGTTSGAIGNNTIAIGGEAKAEGDNSTAIGYNVKTTGITNRSSYGAYGSTAIGMNTSTEGRGTTVIGYGDRSNGNYNTVIGAVNEIAGNYNSVYGGFNKNASNKSTILGFNNGSYGYGSVIVGGQNNTEYLKEYEKLGLFPATGDFGVAIGVANSVLGSRSVGVGDGNMVTGTHAYSFGAETVNTGRESILIGTMSTVGNGENNLENPRFKDDVERVTLVGQYASSKISDSVVLGSYSLATRKSGVAGYDAASGKQLTADEILAKNGENVTVDQLSKKMAELNRVKQELENKMWEADELRLEIQTEKYKGTPLFAEKTAEFDRLAQEVTELQYKETDKKREVGQLIGNWQSQVAAMSIGNEETGATRQITGVAAGTNETDAVNIAQLKSLAEKPVTIKNGGRVEEGKYIKGKQESTIPLNKLSFDYGEGLKATKQIEEDGNEAIVMEVDKDKIPDKKEVETMINNKMNDVDKSVIDVNNRINSVNNKIDRIEKRTSEGLAAVASMAVLDFNNAPVGKVGVGASIGGYRNKQAVAVGVVYGVNENFKVNAKVGIPMNQYRNSAYGVSGTYYFNCN